VDAIDSLCAVNGKSLVLIDTAGIRRKSKTEQGVEVLSVVQARKALERADVALLVLDGETGTTDQDEKIAGLIEEIGCSVILVMNKWDTQRGNKNFTKNDAAEKIRYDFGFLRYAPILFASAKEGTGFKDLGELIYDILGQRRLKIPTHEFTEWMSRESEVHNPANVKFYLSHQVSRHPPTFVSHVSQPSKIHFTLHRHLLNAIRERWGFMGTPLRLLFVEAVRKKGPRRRLERDENGKLIFGKRRAQKDAGPAIQNTGNVAMEIRYDAELEDELEKDFESISEEHGSEQAEE
jgi:GTP-binding protein